MAGLQYYFFPTDFFYPRPSSANGDNASKPVLQVQTQKADSSMAGLQYYFFPTDFFYPRPSSANGDNASKPVLQVQTQKAGAENIERFKIVVHNDVQDNKQLCFQPPASTSCAALVPFTCIIKKEFRRRRSIVANCCNN
nr:hypothetical protein CFP56_35503 [Quercus suber]